MEKQNVACAHNGPFSLKEEILTNSPTWMNSEDLMPNEASQS